MLIRNYREAPYVGKHSGKGCFEIVFANKYLSVVHIFVIRAKWHIKPWRIHLNHK